LLPYHEEAYRLSTFEDGLEGINGSILARCGFYFSSSSRTV